MCPLDANAGADRKQKANTLYLKWMSTENSEENRKIFLEIFDVLRELDEATKQEEWVLFLYGEGLFQWQKYPEALYFYARVTKLNGEKLGMAWVKISWIQFYYKNYVLAEQAIEKAYELVKGDPSFRDIYLKIMGHLIDQALPNLAKGSIFEKFNQATEENKKYFNPSNQLEKETEEAKAVKELNMEKAKKDNDSLNTSESDLNKFLMNYGKNL
jgi:hypothetical protein